MKLESDADGTILVYRPTGVLDATLSHELEELLRRLLEEEQKHLIVDCSDIEMVASSGLQLFLAASRRTRLQGRRMVLAAMPPHVRGIFKLTRLDRHFEFEEGVGKARAQLKERPAKE